MSALVLFSTVAAVSNAISTTHSDIGVMFWPEKDSQSRLIHNEARNLIADTICADADYTTSCTSSNPEGCPCTALTDDERTQILNTHNERRELAASGNEVCATLGGSSTQSCPEATDMNALLWDSELETVATYWAHQCTWGHHSTEKGDEQNVQYKTLCDDNGCLAAGYNGDWIGENLAAKAKWSSSGTPTYTITEVIEGITAWYDESEDYYWDSKTSYGTTGHWTQGVWAKTRYIGCGYAACSVGSPFGSTYSNWLNIVCKYYPGGNYNNQYQYTEGTACSDCESDRSSCSGTNGGLCDGGMCLNCADDYFNSDCGYSSTTCPSTMFYGDGIGDTVTTDNPTTRAPTTMSPSVAITTGSPSYIPTLSPSYVPTLSPSVDPTMSPSAEPTEAPATMAPTTVSPSVKPTVAPTTMSPVMSPSAEPTPVPTPKPITTGSPSYVPTFSPSLDPTNDNTPSPTPSGTVTPTSEPTDSPTVVPTATMPSQSPAVQPTDTVTDSTTTTSTTTTSSTMVPTTSTGSTTTTSSTEDVIVTDIEWMTTDIETTDHLPDSPDGCGETSVHILAVMMALLISLF